MHKKVFIIGNGFDLDLGWKTSYKDFVCSDYWPLKDKEPSLSRNSIILGVDDSAQLCNGYSYLRKVFSEYYTSHPIRYTLQECDEVVFFGHSLGDIDYPYFADFFADQSNCAERKNSKHITIFTKDHKSRFQILEQLRSMNGGRTERLQNDNDFKIIMTDNPNKVLIKKFFDHLKEESLDAHNNMMRRIRLMVL